MQGANLRDAILTAAELSGAQLQGADLAGAKMQGADLGSANLERAVLVKADLKQANLRRARLPGADLSGAKLWGADLGDAHLQAVNLESAELQGAILNGVHLDRANLKHANLQSVLLREGHVQGANLVYAKLQGAELYSAQFQGANLYGAELQGAILRDANFQGAGLFDAQLIGVDLTGANLQAAFLESDLYCAELDEVTLQGIVFERRRKVSIYKTWDLALKEADNIPEEGRFPKDQKYWSNYPKERYIRNIKKAESDCEKREKEAMPDLKSDFQGFKVIRQKISCQNDNISEGMLKQSIMKITTRYPVYNYKIDNERTRYVNEGIINHMKSKCPDLLGKIKERKNVPDEVLDLIESK
jgi:uncharacterized protein YjbI with pentapeptide repeats